MKITYKLIVSFWLIVVCIWVVSFSTIATTKNKLEQVLISQDVRLVREMTLEISHLMYSRLETFMEYGNDVLLRTALEQSNTLFAGYADRDKHIKNVDSQWLGTTDPSENILFKDLMANELSEELREKQEYYRQRYGFDLYKEIFVTNRYGAVAGLTNLTTDYRQDDEEWWQQANENGVHISDVQYHESVDGHSLDFAVRVSSEQGDSLGVLKVTYNFDEILRLLARAQSQEDHSVIDYILTNKKGLVLYSSTNRERFMDDISQKEFFRKASASSGYFIMDEEDKLYIYAGIPGAREMQGHDWILIAGHKRADIFEPVASLREKLFAFALIATVFVALLSAFVIHAISIPLIRLKGAVVAFGSGKLDQKIPVLSSDEIGEVAAAFNAMGSKLQETTVSRDSLVEEVAERRWLEEKISESEKRLTGIFNSMLSGVMIIDEESHKIVDVNPAALALFGMSRQEVIGRHCHTFICPAQEGACPVTDMGLAVDHSERTILNRQGEEIPILKSVAKETINGQRYLIESFVDIRDRKKIEQEKEILIGELQEAIAQVKTLSGIVPICMHCKNIRDDKGYWNKVEQFLAEYSGAQFSHGICDDCIREHYPEVAEDVMKAKSAA
jgi:PAS domain S-box-containing protein